MRKTLKFLLVAVLLLSALLLLTGCGNKIVATKETEDDELGTIQEKLEYKFKDDKVESIKMTYTFEDKETAEDAKKEFDQAMALVSAFSETEIDFEVEQKGKKIVMELDTKTFEVMEGKIETVDKEELKEQLEEQGYKVK